MNNDFQNCPYCESTIKIGVKKCRFCWEIVDKRYEVPKIKNYIWGYTNPAFKKKPQIICTDCGYEWKAALKRGWSWFISFLLLWFFIIPCLVYELKRNKDSYWICPKCKSWYVNKI